MMTMMMIWIKNVLFKRSHMILSEKIITRHGIVQNKHRILNSFYYDKDMIPLKMCFPLVHNQSKTLFCNYSSNPKVQVYMLDNGIMSTLIRILLTKTSQTLRNRILYAMSSLLRHFPFAQQHFLQHGGLQALSTVFQAGGTEKLQLKAVTLINDLVTEKVSILLFIAGLFRVCLFIE